MALTKEKIIDQLRTVMDPELGCYLVTLGVVKEVDCRDGEVKATIELTTPACPLKDQIRHDAETAIRRWAATSRTSRTGSRATT